MKRLILALVLVFCLVWTPAATAAKKSKLGATAVFSTSTVERVENSIVAVLAYYEVPAEQAAKINSATTSKNLGGRAISPNWPIAVPLQSSGGKSLIAFIGAGTMLKDGYVITVSHLFNHTLDDGTAIKPCNVWVLSQRAERPVAGEVVAITPSTDGQEFYKDYAVVKMAQVLGPGTRIARRDAVKGDPVIHAGTVNGAAWFVRFGHLTSFHKFFHRDSAGVLHLAKWTDFPFLCVYPGGPGDSGGGIFNVAGELVGVMYCGTQIAAEQYVFANPLAILREFLTANKLEFLLE